MKLKRIREWREVLYRTGAYASFKAWIYLIKHVFVLGVSKRRWRRRYAACIRCPIYIEKYKMCGPGDEEESQLGCGCYVPFLAMTRIKGCWGRRNFGIGWD
jgi:hypothetical protein|tara:strand:- start:2799 stop:3101 length:303 start_codon:yes stop_codon:yes gene_type:complete